MIRQASNCFHKPRRNKTAHRVAELEAIQQVFKRDLAFESLAAIDEMPAQYAGKQSARHGRCEQFAFPRNEDRGYPALADIAMLIEEECFIRLA